ncbi:hypothetical protein N3K66_005544 [Trichothecium roseum]|uniref:Uncharacterized protein n=1 Tax=Trichothecium roseum TaxID=47278 RepID=A0ACC0UY73_9HYPO|nr:hypothetical protein N3K66_005544 [Trichothecium roseum]
MESYSRRALGRKLNKKISRKVQRFVRDMEEHVLGFQRRHCQLRHVPSRASIAGVVPAARLEPEEAALPTPAPAPRSAPQLPFSLPRRWRLRFGGRKEASSSSSGAGASGGQAKSLPLPVIRVITPTGCARPPLIWRGESRDPEIWRNRYSD